MIALCGGCHSLENSRSGFCSETVQKVTKQTAGRNQTADPDTNPLHILNTMCGAQEPRSHRQHRAQADEGSDAQETSTMGRRSRRRLGNRAAGCEGLLYPCFFHPYQADESPDTVISISVLAESIPFKAVREPTDTRTETFSESSRALMRIGAEAARRKQLWRTKMKQNIRLGLATFILKVLVS